MLGLLTIAILLLGSPQQPEIDASQFAQIVKERAATQKNVAFLYQGSFLWVGPDNLSMTPEKFNDQFQGTFLYRDGVAAVVDVYTKRAFPTASVVRRRMSLLNGKTEEIRFQVDPKTPINPARDIKYGNGSFGNLNSTFSPHELFWSWYWPTRGDLRRLNYQYQGWEDIGGRKCLRIQMDSLFNVVNRDTDFQRLWIDVERDAQVVKLERYVGGKLHTTIDVTLMAHVGKDGQRSWFPASNLTRWYVWEDKIYDNPISERMMSVVVGSLLINPDLPDPFFTVLRNTALPAAGELKPLDLLAPASPLRREYEAQPAIEPPL